MLLNDSEFGLVRRLHWHLKGMLHGVGGMRGDGRHLVGVVRVFELLGVLGELVLVVVLGHLHPHLRWHVHLIHRVAVFVAVHKECLHAQVIHLHVFLHALAVWVVAGRHARARHHPIRVIRGQITHVRITHVRVLH